MSYYITVHNGCVDMPDDSWWVNIVFGWPEHPYLRTDGAVMKAVIERIKARTIKITPKPMDETGRWTISLPVSKDHPTNGDAMEDALQLAQWYLAQIRLGNATINRELLFTMKPFRFGKECCKNNQCDRVLHPEWYEKYANEEATESE